MGKGIRWMNVDRGMGVGGCKDMDGMVGGWKSRFGWVWVGWYGWGLLLMGG